MHLAAICRFSLLILAVSVGPVQAGRGPRQKPESQLVTSKTRVKGDSTQLRASFSGPGAKQVAKEVAGPQGKVRWNPFTRRHSATRTIHLQGTAARKVATRVIGQAMDGRAVSV